MNRFPEQPRPIFLSGKVMLDDGTPPPDSVVIERVCNGNPRAEAYTDSKGRFSFQLGQNQGVMQDASMSSNRGDFGGLGNAGGFGGMNQSDMGGFGTRGGGISERDLMGCEIRAALPGFRSDVVSLSGRRAFDNPDIGTIVLHRMGNVEGLTISATSLQAPKDAKKAYEKSRDLLKKKKTQEAEKELEKAVEIYPKYSVAWYQLGLVREGRNDVEGARKAYGSALAADAKFVKPYHQLAGLSLKEQKWQDVADTTGRLIKLDPVDYPDAYFYNSVANYYLKNYDAAEKSVREAQKLDSRNRIPKTNQLLGVILAEKQDFAGAAEQIKKYLTFLPEGKEAETAKKQLVELEKLTSNTAPAQGQQQEEKTQDDKP
ncbi:MAG TPA: tetratricopeptide repeat protein [Bryobacteraceae bacterium]|nr:tetratricopeptide repeat protein [Bryobacteraceae bacterium]